MKTDTKQVKTSGNVVGEVEIVVYETIDELVEKEDASRILSMFNKQNAVRIMGNERAKHTLVKVGKGKRFEIAYNLLTPDEAREVIGDMAKLKDLIASDAIQKRVDDYVEEQKKSA